MTEKIKKTALEHLSKHVSQREYDASEVPGRELEYFVQLLWQGNVDKTFSYAHNLISNGVKPYVITLAAAQSYFPFAYGAKEQEKRAVKIAEIFSNKPFYWKDSFIDNGFYRELPIEKTDASQDIKNIIK